MSLRQTVLAVAVSAVLLSLSHAQPAEAITPSVDQERVVWPTTSASGHQLRLVAPDGTISMHHFADGQEVMVEQIWQEGHYRFELLELLAAHSARDEDARERGDADQQTASLITHAGGFRVDAERTPIAATKEGDTVDDGDQVRSLPRSVRDQVIADDLIVQSSICAGFDCVDGEIFGFDTLRLKENNVRLAFTDTSVGEYPNRSWAITANDSAEGGLNYLGITDVATGARPFWVLADSRNNAVVVAADRVGFGTSTPEKPLHLVVADTPAIRLEQAGGGWPAQTWDVAGNEANFFVRDATNSNSLPFRIRPGAPTSTLDLAANGNVGIGTATAGAKLQVYRAEGSEPLMVVSTGVGSAIVTQMQLDATGNLRVNGTLSQLSSRAAKTGFLDIDPGTVLDAVANLPISVWSYLHQDSGIRHLGPTAEDFHAAFGLGERPTEIATGDMAGVALAAIQALNQQVAERDQRIGELEARLRRLEERLFDDAGAR